MSRTLIGLGVALLLCAVLIASAPARLLTLFVPAQQLILQGISGTLWNGAASRSAIPVQGGHLQLGQLTWSLRPASLLLMSPELAIDSQWGAQRIAAELVYHSRDNIELSAVDVLLPAALVRQFVPLELTGSFALLSPDLAIADGMPEAGEGRLVWQHGGWISPAGERPLGSYAIDFRQLAGEPLSGEVVTLSGELEASGTVSLDGRNYSVNILLGGRGLDDPQLQQALQLVATPEGDRFRVQLEGAF